MQEKSGLYQVEATDELSMVLHVIGTAKEERIVFIVGEDGRTFHNPANLRVIATYAGDRNREIALVTNSPQLSKMCHRLGLSCFATVEEAKGRKLFPRSRRKAFRAFGWGLVLVVLLAGAYLYAVQTRAVVVIIPSARPWQGELVVAVDPKASGTKGERELTVAHSISPKGRKTVGAEPASGAVSFFNNGTQSIKVPKGTAVVASGGQRYLVSRDTVVPKQQKKYVMTVAVGVSAGQAQAPVVAANKGTSGNVGVGKLNKLEGPLENKLQVINTKPIGGGADKAIPVVTGDDLKELETALVSETKRKVQLGLETKDSVLFADSSKLETQEFNPKGSVGQNLDKLQGTLTVKVSGHILTREEVTGLIAMELRKKNGSWQPQKKNLHWQILEVRASAGQYLLRLNCQGTLMGRIEPRELSGNLAGKTKTQAERILGSMPEVDSFQLSAGRNKLPKWRKLIKVIFQSD
jgi:hypothetical protein